ncbi:uncharacterized protein LOC123382444 [Felis catus]|uniref:uncharacterized protein LOC123382444 n=1 Tax=Felis catus TaxID=9685 RepID=UPI001D1A1179|nr:uncharacterized protein LOC123382444 [Felis catus]
MALLAYWVGLFQGLSVHRCMRRSGGKWRHPATQSVLLGSAIAHRSSVFSSRPLPAFPFSVSRPQAVPLSQVLSQMRLFSPAPYFRRTVALTRSAPLREGLTEQWPNEQWPNVGCTRERLPDPAGAAALRLRPGVSPPPKKIARGCSLSVSGTVENHNTHLAPGFTLNDLVPAPASVAAFRGLLGPGGLNSLYRMSFHSGSGTAFPRVAREPPGPHSVPGDSPFPPAHRQEPQEPEEHVCY